MKLALATLAVALVAPLAPACGGKVVVGVGSDDGAGAGSASTLDTSGTSASTGSPGETSCVKVCTAANACPGAGTPVDCASDCASKAHLAAKGGCSDAFEAAYACFVQIPDTCHPSSDACLSESKALFTCIYDYCGGAPSDPDCG